MAYKLWLLRHAQPFIEKGVCYGQLDVAADAQANELAAHAFAHALRQNGAEKSLVFSSGLQRAQQLAAALQQHFPHMKVAVDVRLKEMHFGKWEGLAWQNTPGAEIEAWTADFGRTRFGGVESCHDVLKRVIEAYQDCVQWSLQHRADVVWLTHGGVIRALHYYLNTGKDTIASAAQWPINAPDFGTWVCCELDKAGSIQST